MGTKSEEGPSGHNGLGLVSPPPAGGIIARRIKERVQWQPRLSEQALRFPQDWEVFLDRHRRRCRQVFPTNGRVDCFPHPRKQSTLTGLWSTATLAPATGSA